MAGEYLRAESARNSVVLTVTEDLRVEDLRVKAAARSQAARSQAARPSAAGSPTAQPSAAAPGSDPDQPLFGWWRPTTRPDAESAGEVGAVCMHAPEFPVLLSQVSAQAAAELVRDLAAAGRQLPGVNAPQEAADAFAAAWRDRTGDAVTLYRRMRLFRLGRVVRPAAGPGEQPGWPPNGTMICWPGGSTRSPARSATRPGTIAAPLSASASATAASRSGRPAGPRSRSPAGPGRWPA